MIEFFDSTDDFLPLFEFKEGGEHFDPIVLKDTKVGFSIKSLYPDNIRFKPAKNQNGEPDDVATLWVTYEHPEEYERNLSSPLVPIRIRASNMSLYRQKHWDYDFEDKDSPSEEAVRKRASSPEPVELTFRNDFFYDHEKKSFVDNTGKEISPSKMLDAAFTKFFNTVHPWKGLPIQTKLSLKSTLENALTILIFLVESLLTNAFGRTLEPDEKYDTYYKGYKNTDLKKLDEDTLNIFGYRAAKSVVITFCGLVVATVAWQYVFTQEYEGYLAHVTSNTLLGTIHGIFALFILDTWIPLLIFYLLNKIIWLRTKVSFMTFRV